MKFNFRILLDHGADANELYNLKYRSAVLNQDNSTTVSFQRQRSIQTISTIEFVMRNTGNKDRLCLLIEKLLSKIDDFEDAIESILEVRDLSFRLLKVVLNVAQQQKGKAIADLINAKYGDDSLTALHMAVSSNYSGDISEEMAYLLEHGGDILIQGNKLFPSYHF